MLVGVTIATITALFLLRDSGGPSFLDPEALRKSLEKAIDDDTRRVACLAILDEMDAVIAGFDDAARRAIDRYLERVPAFEATEAELNDAFEPLIVKRREALLELVGLRARLVDVTTEDEWNAIFG